MFLNAFITIHTLPTPTNRWASKTKRTSINCMCKTSPRDKIQTWYGRKIINFNLQSVFYLLILITKNGKNIYTIFWFTSVNCCLLLTHFKSSNVKTRVWFLGLRFEQCTYIYVAVLKKFQIVIQCKLYACKLKAIVSGWDEKVDRPLGKWCVVSENYWLTLSFQHKRIDATPL